MKPPAEISERFWPKVDRRSENECWHWKGSLSRGYGQMSASRRGLAPLRAHRVAYELANGPISDGLVVRHKCDNPKCVNPSHLEVGSQRENALDMVARGRHNPRSLLNLNHDRVLPPEAASMIKTLVSASMSQSEVARLFGVSRRTVSNYARGIR